MVPIPAAIMKVLGQADLQMTMHYVSLGKSHIRERVGGISIHRKNNPGVSKKWGEGQNDLAIAFQGER